MAQDKSVDPREQRIAELRELIKPQYFDFAHKYVKLNYSAGAAASAAGYADSNRYETGMIILRNPYVKELVKLIAEVAFDESKISTVRILDHLANRAFFDVRNYYREDGTLKPLAELTAEEAVAVDGIVQTVVGYEGKGDEKTAITKIELKLASADKSVEMLGKFHKMFAERRIIEGDPDKPINHAHHVSDDVRELLSGVYDKTPGK